MKRLDSIDAWRSHFLGLATPVLRDSPLLDGPPLADGAAFARAFADERGHRRAVDEPLILRLLGLRGRPDREPAGPDAEAWWLITDPDPEPEVFERMFLSREGGPVISEDPGVGVEIWTETELAGLHALTNAAAAHAGTDLGRRLAARAQRAAAWHVETIQPDNATNHPWAVHLFVVELLRTGDASMLVHAETLANICCVSMGRPDRFSAVLLLDAARTLADLWSAWQEAG